MKTFESSWRDHQGLQFHAKGWEPDRGPKAVVALLHGHGEHVGRYAHVAEMFSQAGYALMGFDLRGHGQSGGARGHSPSFEALMQDIDLFLEQVEHRYPGLPVFLYGHSIGGSLALNYVLRRKPPLKGVIASSPALHTEPEKHAVKVVMAKVLGGLLPAVAISTGLQTSMLSHDPGVERAYLKDPLVHDRISLGFGKMMLESNQWALQHASEFSLPLLLVHGKADAISFPAGSEEFAAALGGRAHLILWKDLYHETHNEPQKAEVLRRSIEWMDALLQGR
jgi:alpha-beta hydrolase superfamily lysophospholipase